MFGIKLSWSIIPAGRGVSLSKASWRDTEVVVCSPARKEKKKKRGRGEVGGEFKRKKKQTPPKIKNEN